MHYFKDTTKRGEREAYPQEILKVEGNERDAFNRVLTAPNSNVMKDRDVLTVKIKVYIIKLFENQLI